jgi:hypothetical protein
MFLTNGEQNILNGLINSCFLTERSKNVKFAKIARYRAMNIPPRFLAAEKGDFAKAQARWQRTLDWRATFKVDDILDEPQLNFLAIKSAFPHSFHGRTRGYDSL